MQAGNAGGFRFNRPRMEKPRRRIWQKLLRVLGFVGIFIGVILLAILFLPLSNPNFSTTDEAGLSFADALAVARTELDNLPAGVRAQCAANVLDHGKPTAKVVVLLHGLSNCPAQYSQLSQEIFAQGYNVIMPRMAFHGFEDRLNNDWGQVGMHSFITDANTAVNLAKSLGDEVIVVGLSVNGTMAAWLAQNRADVSRVVMLAPFMAPYGMPRWLIKPVERSLLRLPNFFLWWDPVLKEKVPGPPDAYPRFPTRLIGEFMFLGSMVSEESRIDAPACKEIVIVTSGADVAIDMRQVEHLIKNWRRQNAGLTLYEFPASDKVPHDLIDPRQPTQRVDFVYPKLLEFILGDPSSVPGVTH